MVTRCMHTARTRHIPSSSGRAGLVRVEREAEVQRLLVHARHRACGLPSTLLPGARPLLEAPSWQCHRCSAQPTCWSGLSRPLAGTPDEPPRNPGVSPEPRARWQAPCGREPRPKWRDRSRAAHHAGARSQSSARGSGAMPRPSGRRASRAGSSLTTSNPNPNPNPSPNPNPNPSPNPDPHANPNQVIAYDGMPDVESKSGGAVRRPTLPSTPTPHPRATCSLLEYMQP